MSQGIRYSWDMKLTKAQLSALTHLSKRTDPIRVPFAGHIYGLGYAAVTLPTMFILWRHGLVDFFPATDMDDHYRGRVAIAEAGREYLKTV